MKKFTFILFAMVLSGAIFAQQAKFAPLTAKQNASEVKVQFDNQGASKVDTDTLYNFDETATLTSYGFGPTVWGAWTGHNEYGWNMFAEKFTTPVAGDLNGFVYIPFSVYDAGGGVVNFKVWDDNAGVPGTELASVSVNLADIVSQDLNNIDLASPIAVDGDFYCGYEIVYNTPVDTFVMVQTQTSAVNTFMFYDGVSAWSDMPTATGGGITGSNLAIGARLNITFTDPLAEVSPSSWAAGGVEVGSDLVSGTFTLTNGGAGTLTVSDVSGIAAPFTTTFVQGDVSLAADETYEFTFTFAPTVEGAASAIMQITTNGGIVNVNLSGTGNTPVTGDMDGGFETNVNDFDLVFTGWTQHDVDASTTYSIQDVTFTNQGYTGSFIAFAPAQCDPAQDIPAHGGDRFGACFAATTPDNNDWLVMPQSAVLGDAGMFRGYVKTYLDTWGLERYAIWVSTTDDQVASFTKISAGTYLEAPVEDWTLIEYDLSAYAGEQVYIAIQCVTSDAFIFMVDDLEIDNPVSVATDVAAAVSVFPNPANNVITIANAENANITIINMVGAVVSTVNNATSNQTIDISTLANGTYFVRVDSEVFKINVVK